MTKKIFGNCHRRLAGARSLACSSPSQVCARQVDAPVSAIGVSCPPPMAAARELRVAAQQGDCGKLRELLDGGGASVVNERTKVMVEGTGEKVETTALIQATGNGQHAAVELLLERKADPNRADSTGYTPLMASQEAAATCTSCGPCSTARALPSTPCTRGMAARHSTQPASGVTPTVPWSWRGAAAT